MATNNYTWRLLEEPKGAEIAQVTWDGSKAVATAQTEGATKAVQSVVGGAKTAAEAYAALNELADALESPIEGPAPGKE